MKSQTFYKGNVFIPEHIELISKNQVAKIENGKTDECNAAESAKNAKLTLRDFCKLF